MAEALDSTASSVTTRKADEQKRQIALIGQVSHQIVGAKLPSNRQVLQVFFYNLRFVNLSAKESARLTLDAVLIFWQQARIPTRDEHKCAAKIIKMYETWRNLNKKPVHNLTAGLKQQYDVFMDTLDDLFDIARADALTTMKNKEDCEFLEKQRQKGRPGSMLGIDMKLVAKENRAELRKQKQEKQRKTKENRKLNENVSTIQQSGKCFE